MWVIKWGDKGKCKKSTFKVTVKQQLEPLQLPFCDVCPSERNMWGIITRGIWSNCSDLIGQKWVINCNSNKLESNHMVLGAYTYLHPGSRWDIKSIKTFYRKREDFVIKMTNLALNQEITEEFTQELGKLFYFTVSIRDKNRNEG